MSPVLVDHPEEWIGIPERFPNSRWETAYQWSSELVEALAEDWARPTDDSDLVVRDLLVSLANSLDPTVASRLYVALGGWNGPVTVAALAIRPGSTTMARTAAEVAGSDDIDVIQEPIVDDFVTNGGVVGASCVRYFERDEPVRVVARIDFVVPVGDGFAVVFHENADLLDFRESLPLVRSLAATINGER